MFRRKKAKNNPAEGPLIAQNPDPEPVEPVPETIEPSEPLSVPCKDGVVIVGKGTQISGIIGTCQVLEVHGVVEADVTTERLVVREGGGIRGNVHSDNAEISGVVEGSLVCYEHLEITGTGEIWADVKYQTLTVAKGAVVKGSIWNDVPSDKQNANVRSGTDLPDAARPSIDHAGLPKTNGTKVDVKAMGHGAQARHLKKSAITSSV